MSLSPRSRGPQKSVATKLAYAAPARRDGHGCLSGFRIDLFRRAAPLLSQKRKGGWNAEEKWSAICFSWLSDAGENASRSDDPLAHKKKKTVQKQIERARCR